jgi:hypothetical protein
MGDPTLFTPHSALRIDPQSHADEFLTRFGPWLRSHKPLVLWPPRPFGRRIKHGDGALWLQPFDRVTSERVTNDLEYLGIVDRAAEFFHPQARGIRNRVFQRIECGWGLNSCRLEA